MDNLSRQASSGNSLPSLPLRACTAKGSQQQQGLGLGSKLPARPKTASPSQSDEEVLADSMVSSSLSTGKRVRPASDDNLVKLCEGKPGSLEENIAAPLVAAKISSPGAPLETLSQYICRVREASLDLSSDIKLSVKKVPDEDGIYVHKRELRGLGPENPLGAGGTLFQHVLTYVMEDGQLYGLDFGPSNFDDVTRNFLGETDARPALLNFGKPVDIPPEDTQPFLYIKGSARRISEPIVREAIAFCGRRKYHALDNNCIHNTDFLVRVLTGGLVRSAPLLYDAHAGKVPKEDPPMLVMIGFILKRTWFSVCDGSHLMAEFLQEHSFPPLLQPEQLSREPGGPPKRHDHLDRPLPTADGGAKHREDAPPRIADIPAPLLGGGFAKPSGGAPPAREGAGAADGEDEAEQYNSFSYWGRPYLDHLHLVPDDA